MYTDSIKYLAFTFTSNNCDDADILKQMRMLYCRSNRLDTLFNKCSKLALLELCRSYCTVFYCPYFWTNYKKTTFSKIRFAYMYITTSIGRSWVCLTVLRLVQSLSRTTFLALKLFFESLCSYLLLEYQFPVTI